MKPIIFKCELVDNPNYIEECQQCRKPVWFTKEDSKRQNEIFKSNMEIYAKSSNAKNAVGTRILCIKCAESL